MYKNQKSRSRVYRERLWIFNLCSTSWLFYAPFISSRFVTLRIKNFKIINIKQNNCNVRQQISCPRFETNFITTFLKSSSSDKHQRIQNVTKKVETMFIYRQKPAAAEANTSSTSASSSSDNVDNSSSRRVGQTRKRKIECADVKMDSLNNDVAMEMPPSSKRRTHKSFMKSIPTPGRSKRSTKRICPVCCDTDISADGVEMHVSCAAGCGVDMCRSCFVRWIDVVITNGIIFFITFFTKRFLMTNCSL